MCLAGSCSLLSLKLIKLLQWGESKSFPNAPRVADLHSTQICMLLLCVLFNDDVDFLS